MGSTGQDGMNNGGEGGNGGDVDGIRRMLEGSWDTSLMGKVPNSPEAAAEAAGKERKKCTHAVVGIV